MVAVDVEGTTWRDIPMPDDEDAPIIDVDDGFIDLSRGRLYLANSDQHDLYKLSIWVLEDYGGGAATKSSILRAVASLHPSGRLIRLTGDQFRRATWWR